jgi:FKBP-type peptidyl-prolyl cis-trans isomerase SlpA
MEQIKEGASVSVNYTGRLEDGTIFDTSIQEGREPLTATLGQGQLIPGFENGLIGMTVGEKRTIEIEPKDAYGEFNEMMVQEVEIDKVPEGVKVGDMLQGQNQYGPVQVTVKEVKDSTVVLDMNHPLAGKKLIFDLEVVSMN